MEILCRVAQRCWPTIGKYPRLKQLMEFYEKEVYVATEMTPSWILRHLPPAVGRRGKAENIDIARIGHIRARARKPANTTDLLKMTSLRMIMTEAEVLVADPIVQKAQKVRRKNRITSPLLVTYRGVAVGATVACELFFLSPTKSVRSSIFLSLRRMQCVDIKVKNRRWEEFTKVMLVNIM